MVSNTPKSNKVPLWLKLFLGGFATLVLAVAGVPLLLHAWDAWNVWERRFPYTTGEALNEAVAIDYAQRAFAKTHINMAGAKPMPTYGDRTNLFFLNTVNTNSGTMSWRVPSMGNERGAGPNCTVRVERSGSELIVTIGRHWL